MTALVEAHEAPTEVAIPAIPVVAPTPRKAKPDVHRAIRVGLLCAFALAGGFVVYLFTLSTLTHARAQEALERRFRGQLTDGVAIVNQCAAVPEEYVTDDAGIEQIVRTAGCVAIASGDPVAHIHAESIGLDEVVVEGTTATQLTKGPGHLRASALPGQPGTSIILGRNRAYSGPFGKLRTLAEDDIIEVTTGQGIVQYTVTEPGRCHGGSDVAPFVPRGDALVLITSCNWLGGGRFAVVAEPAGALQARGTPYPHAPPALDELGLEGHNDAAAPLLVWLQALLATLLTSVVVFRTIRRNVAWIVCTPVVVLCVWLVYEQAARLVPALL
jgi:sortase A